jgi:putative ABC transport system substrate-binding protein
LLGSAAVGSLAVLSRREAAGQQSRKAPRIGFLAVGSREGRAFMIEGFREGLRERGYVEGQNILVE